MAGPRSLRALGRARQRAALQPVASERVRPDARRPETVPAVGQPHAGPSRARLRAGRRGQHRPARPGAGQRGRHGDRGAVARGDVQPAGARGRRSRDLRARERRRHDGGAVERGRVACRHARARAAQRRLRCQSRHAGGHDGSRPSARTWAPGSRRSAGTSRRSTAATWMPSRRRSRPRARSRIVRRSSSRTRTSAPAARRSRTPSRPTASRSAPTRCAPPNARWDGRNDKTFYVPDEARDVFLASGTRGAARAGGLAGAGEGPRRGTIRISGRRSRGCCRRSLPDGWEASLPVYTPKDGDVATRDAGGRALNAIAGVVTNLVGGSADLNPSTKTVMKDRGDFEPPAAAPAAGAPKTQGTSGGPRDYSGRNLHFGVREHAMAAALTGMAVHGGVVPYGATFLTFSDYMRPSIRLAALSEAHVIYVFTHDSLALGEDGPTHQPIEQLASLRAIPHMTVIRPSDATETVEAWRAALLARGPVALDPHASEAARARSQHARAGIGTGQGGVRARRVGARHSRCHPDRHRLRGVARARSQEDARRRRHRHASRLDAVVGAVRGAAAGVSRFRAAAGRPRARQRRGGRHVRLGTPRRRARVRASAWTASEPPHRAPR